MAKTAAQIRATRKYKEKTYDHLKLSFRKDSDINGDAIRAYATARGESLNGFLLRAVTETIERDKSVVAVVRGVVVMKESKKIADSKWRKKAYERVGLSFRKDSDINGDAIRAYATARGESLNGFLLRAVTETIERDKSVN